MPDTRHLVFLSHNSADKPAVVQIQRRLESASPPIPCWLDKKDLRAQGTWMSQLEEVLGVCEVALVFVGPHGHGPIHLKEKQFLKLEAFVDGAAAQLEQIQKDLYTQALAYRDANIKTDIADFAAFKAYFGKKADFLPSGGAGFVRAWWCGDEESLKPLDEMAVTVRCIPFDQPGGTGKCVLTGKDAAQQVVFGRSY